MADISKIKLPDGTTYDLVGKVDVGEATTARQMFPLVAYDEENNLLVTSNRSLSMPKLRGDGVIDTIKGLACIDYSTTYTASKSSGNWSIAQEDIEVVRAGNFVQIRLSFKGNGSAVSGPTNAFVGSLSGGPTPWFQTTLVGYYNAVPVMALFDTDGSISVRPLGSITLTSSGRARVTGMFICVST